MSGLETPGGCSLKSAEVSTGLTVLIFPNLACRADAKRPGILGVTGGRAAISLNRLVKHRREALVAVWVALANRIRPTPRPNVPWKRQKRNPAVVPVQKDRASLGLPETPKAS